MGLGSQEQQLLERRGAVKLWGQKSGVCVSEPSPLTGANGETRGRQAAEAPTALPSLSPPWAAGTHWSVLGGLVSSALTFPTPCLNLQSLGDSPDPPPEVFLVFPCGLFPRTEDKTQFCPHKQSTESWKLSFLLM